jgi:NAD dependent epimerase/dehydratase family enzyme
MAQSQDPIVNKSFFLDIGTRENYIKAKKVIPKILLENEFEFDYPHLLEALTALVD